MKIFKRNNKQRGFSLVEAVLTVLILAIGFMGSLVVTQNITLNALNSNKNIVGVQLANEKLETIMADKQFRGFSYVDNSHYIIESLTPPYNGYSRSVNIVEVQPADLLTPMTGSGIKKVIVTVVWGSLSHQKTVVTGMVSKYN